MVPAAFVRLPGLPLSPNGKVDRRALPAPGEESRAYEPPRNAVEELLAASWAALLGAGPVGAHDDFFALGGHSLLAVRLVSQVSDTFGVRLPVAVVFEAPTLAELAARIAEEMLGRAGDELLAEVFAAAAAPGAGDRG
jgi:acyl carrier protein